MSETGRPSTITVMRWEMSLTIVSLSLILGTISCGTSLLTIKSADVCSTQAQQEKSVCRPNLRNVCQEFCGCLATGSSTLKRHRPDQVLPGSRLTALDNTLAPVLKSILLSAKADLSPSPRLFCSHLKLNQSAGRQPKDYQWDFLRT